MYIIINVFHDEIGVTIGDQNENFILDAKREREKAKKKGGGGA